jgi:hypothetical protein
MKQWLRKLKAPKFLYPIRCSYEEFNEYDKLKFKNNLIIFKLKA